ncbi:MAG: proton-conducting transporter membrane subunit [Tenuifilaceae bacterium]
MKLLVEIFNLIAILTIISIPYLKVKGKGIVTLIVISLQVILASIISITVLGGNFVDYSYGGSYITGPIPIRIDYLSAWFILTISFTFLTGAIYGIQYMKKYSDQKSNISLHVVAYILTYTSLIDICIVQNSLVFLVIWEIMAISSFILIIFEHYKKETLRAGINFLIQSHICIIFLTLAFIWVKINTGTFDFNGITLFTQSQPALISIGLFTFFFFGFAIKAGFVPFHTWLPLAHPAAPAHISGVMSGVIIKIGIFGILKVLLLIKTNFITIGFMILIISVITGVYGVMLAIVQHNLKKLLAYHSIENIGIIGIGIGMGCLGIGYQNQLLIVLGFSGALLHTLNHSLFKSLLFYSSGNVYQLSHSINIESLGGLIKKMPHTAILFLVGSLAICGLPPFNGFISEFLIYIGLFKTLTTVDFPLTILMLFSILGLVLIGGLAMICFTKAFGIVFLGETRQISLNDVDKEQKASTLPLYAIVALIIAIGVVPMIFLNVLSLPVNQFATSINVVTVTQFNDITSTLSKVGIYSALFIIVAGSVILIRMFILKNRPKSIISTWGCGYVGSTKKMQYTASSFIRTYRKLFEPFLQIIKVKKETQGLFPSEVHQETHPSDKIEVWLIDKPIHSFRQLLSRFTFLQNGNVQAYILYGFIFISLIIIIPQIIEKIKFLINFLNQL